ncbi:MAG: hypothetical protein ACOX5Q_04650 [Bacillota bacterium]|jgi:A/G-specific adenine glycosylase
MVDPSEVDGSEIARVLLQWWQGNGRWFPWRRLPAKPYGILVAEIMLRRTTAAAVARDYDRFLERFPSVNALASASIDEIANALQGIGLYRQRASAFHQMANHVLATWGGQIPETLNELLSIPHVGSYTAHAVLAFCFNAPVGVVDCNVVRVVNRLLGKTQQPLPIRECQKVVDYWVPIGESRSFCWALLDFGAAVCRYRRPACQDCSLSQFCRTQVGCEPGQH